ncbi:hypothetical protein ACGEP9_19875 [Pseudomonas aeruginosa]
MGKKTIIAVTALALLGLGGGAYLELGGKAPAGAGEAAAEARAADRAAACCCARAT